jgi:REP element-mobilizing transposase RayT
MPRKRRFDEAGAWHHIVNRGLARRPVFENRVDARYFLSRLAYAVRRGELEVHAFCLMTTHFHLLVRSPRALVSAAMRRIENDYVRRFNQQRRRDGALFRGRFFSRVVETEHYRRAVVRYIVGNLVEAGLAARPQQYEGGSARCLLEGCAPPWLELSWIEAEIQAVQRRGYSRTEALAELLEPLTLDQAHVVSRRSEQVSSEADPFDELIGAAAENVRDWMLRKARLADRSMPGLAVLGPRAVEIACEQARRDAPVWTVRPRRKGVDGWQVASIYLLRDLCALQFAEIAQRLDVALSTAHRRFADHCLLMERDPDYVARVASVTHAALLACHRMSKN